MICFAEGSDVIYIATALTTIEFLLLLPYCLMYYYDIINRDFETELSNSPAFWVVTGIAIYSLVSIPYYLLVYYFYSIRYVYNREVDVALSIIPFTLNFILLSKSFTLKKGMTK